MASPTAGTLLRLNTSQFENRGRTALFLFQETKMTLLQIAFVGATILALIALSGVEWGGTGDKDWSRWR